MSWQFQYQQVVQDPKLTFLCGRQVATEIFFFCRQMENSGRQQVSVKFLLHSETQKHKVFKGAQSRRFRRFLVKTVLKLLVANFIHAQHCV